MPTLRSREDFARVGEKGRSRADRLMVVRFVPNAHDHDRFGISTGRRLGGAVQRNRVRRRIREILRHAPNGTGQGWDILIVARAPAVDASFDELRTALERLLHAIRGSVKTSS
ncbi:MAG: ribonuclease P protein component [Chloroflexota bacterium]|nr:ribonuclease P protein component [Chloroflexota bacterium]